MMFLALWVVALAVLASWSALVWAASVMLTALLSQAGQLSSGDWQLPASLAGLLPVPVAEWLAGTLETLAPQLQSLLAWAPALSGGVTVLAWVAWGLVAVPLLLVAAASHAALRRWRRGQVRMVRPTLIPS